MLTLREHAVAKAHAHPPQRVNMVPNTRNCFVRIEFMAPVPAIRVRSLNDQPPARDGQYVLYWMIAARRTRWNFALDHAVDTARRLGKPLVVFEPLRCDYRWASDRLHRFVIDGMRDNQLRLANTSVRYFPYVEPAIGSARGLLSALARRACIVVTDDFPCFFLPRMVAAAAQKLPVAVEASRLATACCRCAPPSKCSRPPTPFAATCTKTCPRICSTHPGNDPLAGKTLPPAKPLPASDLDAAVAAGGARATAGRRRPGQVANRSCRSARAVRRWLSGGQPNR